jgi:hypothetical protein
MPSVTSAKLPIPQNKLTEKHKLKIKATVINLVIFNILLTPFLSPKWAGYVFERYSRLINPYLILFNPKFFSLTVLS